MGASARPERPSLEDIIRQTRERPSLASLVAAPATPPTHPATAPKPADDPSYLEQVNRRLLALTDFVPGAHALIAGGRAALDPNRDYADEARGIQESVAAYNADDSEKWRRRMLKVAGGLPVGAAAGRVAQSVPLQSALIGASGAAGVADAELSDARRAAGTVVGGVAGGLLGKGLEVAGTAVQGLAATKPIRSLIEMGLERAKAAKQLYNTAFAEGNANAMTPATQEIDDFLKEPLIASVVDDLQQVREFRNVPPNSPKMLDAIIKELSDRSGMIRRGQMAANPSRPNAGRIREQEVAGLKEQGLDAISGPTGPMPTYITAVQDYARRSRLMDAYRRGYESVRSEATVGLPSIGGIEKRAPESFGQWLQKQSRNLSPAETAELQKAGADGVAGATKEAMRRMSFIRPLWSLAAVEALAEAPAVLRNAGIAQSKPKTLMDMLSATGAGAAGNRVGGLLSR